MDKANAITICNEWLTYLERQRERSKRLQELSNLARKGPEEHKRAKQELRRLERQSPTVYDGGRLEPAVKYLIKALKGSDDG